MLADRRWGAAVLLGEAAARATVDAVDVGRFLSAKASANEPLLIARDRVSPSTTAVALPTYGFEKLRPPRHRERLSRASKKQMHLERHLARIPAGLALRIAQRILALTLGILLDTLTGRPARYDGR